MKFKYNNKIYVVFADIKELTQNKYIVKIDEDYLYFDPIVKTDNQCTTTYYLNKTTVTNTTTTHVLNYISKGNKILLAYEVQLIENYIDGFSNEYFTGEVEEIIEKLQYVKDCKITYDYTNFGYPFRCNVLTEATEDQMQDIICQTCKDVKYYNP